MKRLYILTSLVMCALAQAQQPQLEAHEAWVDLETNELVINGVNFDNGNVLEVKLGDVPLTVVPSVDATLAATEIRAAMPAIFSPGTYTVLITSGGGSIRYDQIDITVGNTGPRGPEGPPGPQGDPGATGAKGDTGDQGPRGQDGDDCTVAQLGTPDNPLGATVTCGATVATIPKGDKGEPGTNGIDGAPGADGVNGLPGPAGQACWDLNGDGAGDVATEDFNADEVVDVYDCKGDQVINLSVEIPDVPGLVAQDFVTIFPDAAKSTTFIEIEGICAGEGVVVNGPGFEIDVIPGFLQNGWGDNQSGLSTELPLVLEFFAGDLSESSGFCAESISTWINTAPSSDIRPISIITKSPSALENVRWNIYALRPTSEQPGFDGRRRFVLEVVGEIAPVTNAPMPNPNFLIAIERMITAVVLHPSLNLATDKAVEIVGINFGYPVVEEEDLSANRLVLVYDLVEAAGIFDFAKEVAQRGTEYFGKRDIAVFSVDDNANEIPGTRFEYLQCFPIRWEQFTGFRLASSLKERVTMQCDFSRLASF